MIFFLHLQMAALSSQLSLTSFHPYAFPSYKKMVTMIMILILAEDHKDCLAHFYQSFFFTSCSKNSEHHLFAILLITFFAFKVIPC